MIWLDWLFVLAIALSALTSFMRGALREIISLAAWILGAYVAFMYSGQSQALLEPYIETPEFRYAIVFMTILIIFLILGAVLGILLSRLVNAIGLTSVDKSLGALFGIARGLLLVIVFIIVASFTALPKSTWWDSSWFIAKLQTPADKIAAWVKDSGYLPEETWNIQGAPDITVKPEITLTPKASPEKPAPVPPAPHVPGTLAPVQPTGAPAPIEPVQP